jgi:hypothetical protein
MNPPSDTSGNGGVGQDQGQPIAMLKEAAMAPSSDFIGRVRRKIHRRTTASQLASYSWHMPKVVLLEMANLFGHIVKASVAKKESGK